MKLSFRKRPLAASGTRLLCFGLLVAACASSPKPVANEAAPEATAPTPGTSGVLGKLEQGDVACYVTIDGKVLMGDFDLCPGGPTDATPFIGRKVSFATRKEHVAADACQGNPSCSESKTVDLVITIMPAP